MRIRLWDIVNAPPASTTAADRGRLLKADLDSLGFPDREVIYDAEHFFDGYKSDPEYALRTLAAALSGGASNLTLCDNAAVQNTGAAAVLSVPVFSSSLGRSTR